MQCPFVANYQQTKDGTFGTSACCTSSNLKTWPRFYGTNGSKYHNYKLAEMKTSQQLIVFMSWRGGLDSGAKDLDTHLTMFLYTTLSKNKFSLFTCNCTACSLQLQLVVSMYIIISHIAGHRNTTGIMITSLWLNSLRNMCHVSYSHPHLVTTEK